MIVYNLSTGKSIISNCSTANSFFKRLKGLLGTKSLNLNAGLIIYPCNSIHTYFMKYSIAVLFLDNNKNVLHIISAMPPNKVSKVIKNSKYVIELHPDALILQEVSIGDVFSFK